MTLEFVVLHLGKQVLEVVVTGDDERKHRIIVKWKEKIPSDIPPETWLSSVQGEYEFQRSEVAAAKAGRTLIR